MVDVTNQSHENPAEHQYVVSIDDVTEQLMACTCPYHVHHDAFCKQMAEVENATDAGVHTLSSSYMRTTQSQTKFPCKDTSFCIMTIY